MRITIDAITGNIFPEVAGGVVGFFSWRRLASILRDAGEIKRGERVLSYRIDEAGVHFRVGRS